MLIAIIPVLMIVIGVLMYALSSNAKVAEIGRLMTAAGLFALAFAMSGKTISF